MPKARVRTAAAVAILLGGLHPAAAQQAAEPARIDAPPAEAPAPELPDAEAVAPEPPELEWAVAAGSFNTLNSQREPEGTVEVRLPAWRRLPLFDGLAVEPAFGLTGTGEGSLYLYSSLRLDLFQAADWFSGRVEAGGAHGGERRWRVTPFTGVGLYERGEEGKRLGGPVEFRSGLEVSVRLGERSRLGLVFSHLSNAGLYDTNPGAESLALVWSRR